MDKTRYVASIVDTWVKAYLMRFPRAVEHEQTFLAVRGEFGDKWPDWCGLPMAAVFAIATDGAHDATSVMLQLGPITLVELTAALLWRRSKMVYKYDPDLRNALCAQPLDDKLPIDTLFRLPYHCVFIEAEMAVAGDKARGFWAWLECDAHTLVPELRILWLMRDRSTVSMPIILSGGTLDDSLEALIKSGIERMQVIGRRDIDVPPAVDRESIIGAINLVLYLCSDDPDITGAAIRRRPTDKRGVPKTPEMWNVGVRIGAAIREYGKIEAKHRNVPEDGRASPRPHIRRAHWHHFWHGSKDARVLGIKWLPPIPVGTEFQRENVVVLRNVVLMDDKRAMTDGQDENK